MDNYETGAILSFGGYDCRVLDNQPDRLLITERIIEQRSYHDTYSTINWAASALRGYLNGEFYDRFSDSAKAKILPVINKNPDNQWYGTAGGPDTTDHLFLLSLEDVACRYFGDSSAKLYHPGKNQRYWFERKDNNNRRRLAALATKKEWCWWWLRSPGRVSLKAAFIHGIDGNIGIQGNNILKRNIADGKCTGGVRPALWLKL